MNDKQLKAIEDFGDRIGDYVHRKNPRRFLKTLLYAKSAWEFRNALAKEQRNEYLEKQDLLFTFQNYLDTFAVLDGSGLGSWALVRDLISIRLIERLHALGVSPEILPEVEENEEELEPSGGEKD